MDMKARSGSRLAETVPDWAPPVELAETLLGVGAATARVVCARN